MDKINRRVLTTGLLSGAMSFATAGIAQSPVPALATQFAGFPGETNTGPVAHTIFQDYTGNYEVRTDNAVVSGLRVTGAIVVHANNVTVQNCVVNGSGQLWCVGVPGELGNKNLKVLNCRLYGVPVKDSRDASHLLDGVYNAIEVGFCEIYGCENGVDGGGSLYMHDNYIHDFADWGEDHDDGLQTYGWDHTGGLRVIHNTIVGIETGGAFSPTRWRGASSCLALSDGQFDMTIDGNLFFGGSYTIYGPSQHGASPVNVHVTNNRFSRRYYPRCGAYGTHSGFNRNGPGFLWSGNVWHETGAIIPP